MSMKGSESFCFFCFLVLFFCLLKIILLFCCSASQNNNNISTTYAKLNDVTDTLTSITLSFIMFHCNFILVLSLFITLLTKLGNNSD